MTIAVRIPRKGPTLLLNLMSPTSKIDLSFQVKILYCSNFEQVSFESATLSRRIHFAEGFIDLAVLEGRVGFDDLWRQFLEPRLGTGKSLRIFQWQRAFQASVHIVAHLAFKS